MDHLLLPEGKGHIRVPNLTSSDYTSGDGGFEGYPARQGWTPEDVSGKDNFGGRSFDDIAAFFQSWLYFGCAVEVFGASGLMVQVSDFLDSDRRFVSTLRLPALIRRWERRVGAVRDKEHPLRVCWATEIALILKRVSEFVDLYCLPYYGPGTPRNVLRSPLPDNVWVSIIALGEALTKAMMTCFDIRTTALRWGASAMLRERMLRKGWCPMDVERVLRDMGVDGHYYIAKMANPEASVSHDRCTKEECRARSVDEAAYRQKHVHGGFCGCGGAKKVETERLLEIVGSDEIPVFRWNLTEKQLVMASSRIIKRGVSDLPYVAISHVWSDGMGNPTENAVLECQLQQLQMLVESASESSKLRGNPQHFWLDTLCVPVGESNEAREMRKLSIRKMANIYKGASGVLVLSSTLQNVSSTDDVIKRSLALYFMNWLRRLWTFQEGVFAERLLFQFADRAVEDPDTGFLEASESILRDHYVMFPGRAAGIVRADFVVFREILRRGFDGPLGPRLEPLVISTGAIQFRSTSKLSDESICLSALMRLKSKRLHDAGKILLEEYRQKGRVLREGESIPEEELAKKRLEIFFSIIRAFPREIAFNTHVRLEKEGFRWAPTSLLGSPRYGLSKGYRGGLAILDKYGRGLSIKGLGVLFAPLKNADASSRLLVQIPQEGRETLELGIEVVRTSDYLCDFSWGQGYHYAIILSEPILRYGYVPKHSEHRDYDKRPTSGLELENWFKHVFEISRSTESRLVTEAIVGTVRDMSITGNGNDMDAIQIRHECLANVTLLNISAVMGSRGMEPVEDAEPEESSDSAWETESEGASEDPDSTAESYSMWSLDSGDFQSKSDLSISVGSNSPSDSDSDELNEPVPDIFDIIYPQFPDDRTSDLEVDLEDHSELILDSGSEDEGESRALCQAPEDRVSSRNDIEEIGCTFGMLKDECTMWFIL